jgi:hypothetical protein
MPFDPAKPASSTNASSAEMRAQLNALHTDIQSRALQSTLDSSIASTAVNPAGIQTFAELSITFADANDQQLAAKIDELIMAIRRP